MPQIEQNPQLDERTWQAWMQKNEARDKVRSARRLKLIGIVALLLALSALLWRAYSV